MTEAILALIPTYGLMLVFGVVLLACLAMPLPASMLVLASGGFAAAGDLTFWTVFGLTFLAFAIGDQIAFALARQIGPPLLTRIARTDGMRAGVSRAEALLMRHGDVAVLISHTVLSPTAPYVTYLCGAGGLGWLRFTLVALPGALIWTTAYVGLGYTFADQLGQVAEILSDFFGIVIAGAIAITSAIWLRRRVRSIPTEPRSADV